MGLGLIGKKLGMTRVFNPDGDVVPVTVIQAGPCPVTQIKTVKTDRYNAVQLGFDDAKAKNVSKALKGHFGKTSVPPKRITREFRLDEGQLSALGAGEPVTVSIFQPGEYVDVTGVSKGRGYAGGIKRHGFHGFPGSHGTHEYFRHGGSVGSRFPQGTFRGHRMAGHYGVDTVTMQNLQVVEVRPEQNVLVVKGAVPGANRGYLVIQPAKRKQKAEAPAKSA